MKFSSYKNDKYYESKLDNDRFSIALDAYILHDMRKSFKLFINLCNEGDMKSCARVGLMFIEGNYVERDLDKAREYYEKACFANDGSGCSSLADFYKNGVAGFEVDYKKADELYEKACKLGYITACYNLAILYDEHDEVESDYKKAAKYYTFACDNGDSWAWKPRDTIQ